jgi:hypothetical protein
MTDETISCAEAAVQYNHWYGPATFFRCPPDADSTHADTVVIGAPFTGGTSGGTASPDASVSRMPM